jgi:tubulin polyglutamylase TTLL4
LTFIKREKGRLPYSVFKPHAQESTFLESIFEGRQATAFFQYPAYVKIERKCDRIRKYKREEVETLFMAFKIADNTHIYNAVVNSCKCAGWTMLENSDLFNLQWTGYVMPIDIKDLNRYQKTNHFPGSTCLGRKDLLWRNLNRLRIKFPTEFTITPMSFILSEDFE